MKESGDRVIGSSGEVEEVFTAEDFWAAQARGGPVRFVHRYPENTAELVKILKPLCVKPEESNADSNGGQA